MTIIFINCFWYIVYNYIVLDIFSDYKSIFKKLYICLFNNFNYDSLFYFYLYSNDNFHLKNLPGLNFEFNFFKFISNILNIWLELELKELKEYDIIGGVQKQVIQKEIFNIGTFYNLEPTPEQSYSEYYNKFPNFNSEIIQYNYEEASSKNKEYIRWLFSEKMKEQGGLITKSLNLSIYEELEKIIYESQAYEGQKQKFQNIIINIDQGKEEFFPVESKILFLEYLEVISHLLEELNSRKLNIVSGIPLPEQTEKELEFLTKDILSEETKFLAPQNIPLPEQSEEEINSLLEPEDFMFDALNLLDIFSENDKI